MKQQIHPAVAAIVILAIIGAIVGVMYMKTSKPEEDPLIKGRPSMGGGGGNRRPQNAPPGNQPAPGAQSTTR